MAIGTVVKNTVDQLNIDIQTESLFLGSNSYERGELSNPSGSEVTVLAGTIVGRISATGLLLPLAIGASDGSQHFVGVLTETAVIGASSTAKVTICIEGMVDSDLLKFNAAETLESVVEGRQLRDIIAGQGIRLIAGIENTAFDN